MPASRSTPADWGAAYDIPLLLNMQPAGKYLGERFHRAGGVPAILCELLKAGRLDGAAAHRDRKNHGREHRRAARRPTAR